MTRLALCAVLLTCFALAGLESARSEDVSGAKAPRRPAVKELSAQGVKSIAKGLDWLARHQERDGSWKANVGYKLNENYMATASDVSHPGISALAGMSFLAGGHMPGRGKYGKNVERAVEYVLSTVNMDGMVTQNGSRMYSHAFATLFLAEVYGMTRDTKVKTALERATEFTWKCQNKAGAWRYAPYAQDSDMSITVCQVMALRAARNIGIRVPIETIDNAVNYVLESANTDPHREPGSFKYQYRKESPIPTRNSFALTAAGLATLYSAGLYTDQDILDHIRKHRITRFLRRESAPKIDPILRYIDTHYPQNKDHYFFYYGNYYAVQAMFIAGGKWWEQYFRKVQADLVAMQRPDGHWPIDPKVGKAYSTASATLILQIPYRYLPIFQR